MSGYPWLNRIEAIQTVWGCLDPHQSVAKLCLLVDFKFFVSSAFAVAKPPFHLHIAMFIKLFLSVFIVEICFQLIFKLTGTEPG